MRRPLHTNPAVADLVRRVLAQPSDPPAWPAADFDRERWTALTELGLTVPLAPEDLGGGGGTLPDAVSIVYEAAYTGLALPLGECALLAGPLCTSAGHPVPSEPFTVAIAPELVVAPARAGSVELTGTVADVPWARAATVILLLVPAGEGAVLVEVERAATGVGLDPGQNLAGEPRDQLSFSGTPATASPLPNHAAAGPGCSTWAAWWTERGALLRAVQLTAAAARVQDLTLAHVLARQQFGRPLAAFQLVQHAAVEIAEAVTLMGAAVDAAVTAVAANDAATHTATDSATARLLTAIAKAETSAAAGTVAALGHQMHGAIGLSAEHSLGTATTRLWAWRDEFGAENEWRDVVADAFASRFGDLWDRLTAISPR